MLYTMVAKGQSIRLDLMSECHHQGYATLTSGLYPFIQNINHSLFYGFDFLCGRLSKLLLRVAVLCPDCI